VNLKLHLGVFEYPYATHVPENARRVVSRLYKSGSTETFTAAPAGAETTGDIASILEAKYHVIEIFYETYKQQIADLIANEMAGSLESLMQGKPLADPIAGAMSEITKLFKNFILSGEIEKMGIPGVPTKAALDGVQTALESRKGARRPSFKDTGLYVSAFTSWTSNG
jgi:hypothetical protein